MNPFFSFVFFCLLSIFPVGFSANQSDFFFIIKSSLSGVSLSNWDVQSGFPICNLKGVTCHNGGYVERLDMTRWELSGEFPDGVCSYLPELKALLLSRNNLYGNFLRSILNCSLLEELDLSFLYMTGTIPDLSSLRFLKTLDLSYNRFTGPFPLSVFNLTRLESVSFNENDNFERWELPETMSGLKNLKTMILTTCRLHGAIPSSISDLTSLVDLELSGNFLVGGIPPEIGRLKKLKCLELYYNFGLTTIPDGIGDLSELEDVDISVNKITRIPASICRLRKLRVLQLYNNSLAGEIPSCLGNSTALQILSLYGNFLTGPIPWNLGVSSELIGLDLSENYLSGTLPAGACAGGKLLYFLVLENNLTGELPESFSGCESLLRFRVSSNNLHGRIPEGIFGLPHVSIVDLSNNYFSGEISRKVGSANNMSELFLQNNMLSGPIPEEISGATALVKVYLSYNGLSGPIPEQIGMLRKLNELVLQGNKLTSSIPDSISTLKSLNVLDLSNNLLTGDVPEWLADMQQASVNLSCNHLSGAVPLVLAKRGSLESLVGNEGLCVKGFDSPPIPSCPRERRRRSSIWGVTGVLLVIFAVALADLRRRAVKLRRMAEDKEVKRGNHTRFEVKSFHRRCYDPVEIAESLIDKNVLGQGGSGKVYKVELNNGEMIAVKRLRVKMETDRGLKAEVETLGTVRHKNIVKLYSYISSIDGSLLVYEFMPNGNLWDALHGGSGHLTWPVRHRIAVGVAQGISYLHHHLVPPVIHRDIKTTNILLDSENNPKVADFGIAKVLQAKGKESTTTVVAGTYGYLAPEYAYTSKASTKCDVYSFGVVLMELVTGRRPVEAEFGESKSIIQWAFTKLEEMKVEDVMDEKVSPSFGDEMVEVLKIALRCSSKTPASRPTMEEVVKMLMDADPSKNGQKYSFLGKLIM